MSSCPGCPHACSCRGYNLAFWIGVDHFCVDEDLGPLWFPPQFPNAECSLSWAGEWDSRTQGQEGATLGAGPGRRRPNDFVANRF